MAELVREAHSALQTDLLRAGSARIVSQQQEPLALVTKGQLPEK
jgi:hypothetical protein